MTGAILLGILGHLFIGTCVVLMGHVVVGRQSLVACLQLALVDRRLLLGWCRWCRLTSPGCRALGLLHGGTLEEGV
jgi:hypothetical protein